MRAPLDLRSIRRREGRDDKAKKCQDHEDPCFTHQRENHIYKSNADQRDLRRLINFNRSFETLKKKIKRQCLFVF